MEVPHISVEDPGLAHAERAWLPWPCGYQRVWESCPSTVICRCKGDCVTLPGLWRAWGKLGALSPLFQLFSSVLIPALCPVCCAPSHPEMILPAAFPLKGDP